MSGWIIPRLTEEVEFRLAAAAVEIRQVFHSDPQAVVDLAVMLARQNAIQECLIRQAVQRVAELESQRPGEGVEQWLAAARELAPRPWWKRWLRRK
jgi:hypothetical protein